LSPQSFSTSPSIHQYSQLNISTIGGYIGNPTAAYYSSSKFGEYRATERYPVVDTNSNAALEGFTYAYLKELAFWNVAGSIIEPGGFDSEWKGSSAVRYPAHEAYADPENPCAKFRKLREANFETVGNARRMALALHKLADEPNLPLRIPFGTDAHFLISNQAKKTIQDADKYEEVSRSTDREDVDGKAWVRDVLLGSGNFKTAE